MYVAEISVLLMIRQAKVVSGLAVSSTALFMQFVQVPLRVMTGHVLNISALLFIQSY